ncbi:MAG: hypothetical protein ACOYIK_07170 [Coriobacteriales bacterium]|jgi:hypothetical protein
MPVNSTALVALATLGDLAALVVTRNPAAQVTPGEPAALAAQGTARDPAVQVTPDNLTALAALVATQVTPVDLAAQVILEDPDVQNMLAAQNMLNVVENQVMAALSSVEAAIALMVSVVMEMVAVGPARFS